MPEKIELRKLVTHFTTSFKILPSYKWPCFISRINLFEDWGVIFFLSLPEALTFLLMAGF